MGNTFSIQRRVQFAETDIAGVLHFSNYFRLMEETEHAFWRHVGISVIFQDGPTDVSWPRVNVGCEYFAPARFEDVLDLELRVTRMGERSIEFVVEFRCESRRLALGRMTAVCCAMRDGKFSPVAVPNEVREKLAPWLNAP